MSGQSNYCVGTLTAEDGCLRTKHVDYFPPTRRPPVHHPQQQNIACQHKLLLQDVVFLIKIASSSRPLSLYRSVLNGKKSVIYGSRLEKDR